MNHRHCKVAILLALALTGGSVRAQARPDLDWRTLTTLRFRVHYSPGLEELARRTMVNADSAFERLARELPTPRLPIDIVVTDHIDWANGSATPFPTNRMVIHARPPVDDLALRDHEDWNLTLVTHEMAHVFQVDRAEGWWGIARRIFGRAAPFYPNTYAPSWLLEGLAVHYETKFSRGGRLAGSEFPAHARALAIDSVLPPVTGLALPTPFFPGGASAYLFGSFLVERSLTHHAAFGQDTTMAAARLIRRMSERANPWRLDASSREAVGGTFTAIHALWRDSVMRSVARPSAAMSVEPAGGATARTLVAPNWTMRFPRFLPDGGLIAVIDDRRLTPAAVRVDRGGQVERIGRRNAVDAGAPTAEGAVLRGELDFTDPYSTQSDLYVGEGLGRRRLTHGARLAHPDLHQATGRIIAVRTAPGTTELVTLSLQDPTVASFAAGSLDRSWTEPRFSASGSHVAAALWERGGRTSIVVLDQRGDEVRRFSPRAADGSDRLVVVSAPAWFPGDTALVFASDHDGAPQIYRGDVRSGAYSLLWGSRTALNTPDISADGAQLAAVELRGAGWALVVRDLAAAELPSLAAAEAPARDAVALPPLAPVATPRAGTTTPTRFDPRVSLAPSWWLPSFQSSDDATPLVGGFTFGRDVIGRHRWNAAVLRDLAHPEFTLRGGYDYAGLGNPTLSFSAAQEWVHGAITSGGERIGTLARRDISFSVAAVAERVRVRNSTYAIIVGDVDYSSYRTYPSELISQLSGPSLTGVRATPSVALVVGGSTMRRPLLALTSQDGVEAQLLYRYRPNDGIDRSAVGEAIVTGAVAKSIPLPGFARHVIAARAAVGLTDPTSLAFMEVGGLSGSSIQVIPGIEVGDAQRTFFVRGFAPSTQVGVRAATASAEYRMPLMRVGRGAGHLPVFLQKISLLAFADAGAAWCDQIVAASPVCSTPAPRSWIASAGGELTLDAALQYDVLYRFRLGFARPVRGAESALRSSTFYISLGNSF